MDNVIASVNHPFGVPSPLGGAILNSPAYKAS